MAQVTALFWHSAFSANSHRCAGDAAGVVDPGSVAAHLRTFFY